MNFEELADFLANEEDLAKDEKIKKLVEIKYGEMLTELRNQNYNIDQVQVKNPYYFFLIQGDKPNEWFNANKIQITHLTQHLKTGQVVEYPNYKIWARTVLGSSQGNDIKEIYITNLKTKKSRLVHVAEAWPHMHTGAKYFNQINFL